MLTYADIYESRLLYICMYIYIYMYTYIYTRKTKHASDEKN